MKYRVTMQNARRAGRWRTGAESRQRILDAARSCFAERGYDRATIRAIASAAHVDPSMVHYFFTTKARLFSLVMELPPDIPGRLDAQLAGGTDGLGERLVLHFVKVWDEMGTDQLSALVRTAATGDRSMFTGFVEREIVGRLRGPLAAGAQAGDDRAGADDGDLRAELIGSHLIGLAFMRYVLRLSPLVDASPQDIAAWMGPALQQYLSGSR